MKYFKLNDGAHIAVDDPNAVGWVGDGVEITEAQFNAAIDPNTKIDAAISARLGKAIREGVKTGSAAGLVARLKAMVDEEEAAGAKD